MTLDDNVAAFARARLRAARRDRASRRSASWRRPSWARTISLPVIISPTGVQAVHPAGEVAVARAAAARGTAMGLELVRQQADRGGRRGEPADVLPDLLVGIARARSRSCVERASAAGAAGIIVTLDWTFAHRRDWGSPAIPERLDLKTMARFAPEGVARPRWLPRSLRARRAARTWRCRTSLRPGEQAPTFFGAYGEWMQTPPPTWDGPRVAARAVGRAVHGQGRHAARRRAPCRRRRRRRDLGLQPRRQQPRRHAGVDPRAARGRRGRRRRGRGRARRRHPPGQRRRQGARARRPRGDDRPRRTSGGSRPTARRAWERARHPAQRDRRDACSGSAAPRSTSSFPTT